jgi:hypothetical protein
VLQGKQSPGDAFGRDSVAPEQEVLKLEHRAGVLDVRVEARELMLVLAAYRGVHHLVAWYCPAVPARPLPLMETLLAISTKVSHRAACCAPKLVLVALIR